MPADILLHRRSWIRAFTDQFLTTLAERRYTLGTLRYNARLLEAFGDFTAQRCGGDLALMPQWVDPFVAAMRGDQRYRRKRRSLLVRFIRFLQDQQVIPAPADAPRWGDAIVEDYLLSLRDQRGLCPASIEAARKFTRTLREYLNGEGISDFRVLRPDIIHRFITRQGQRYSRDTMRRTCSLLRRFLTFLYRREVLTADLAGAVIAPRVYKHEQCPRFLTRAEIDKLRAAVDRTTPVGKRDHAMLLLLATYGLRGIEVVRLRLDDIDWRGQLLHVRKRKAGNSTTYPLSVAVGEAVLAYLRQVRPASAHREVFLTMQAPFTPLARGSLRTRVMEYFARSGVSVPRPGTHSFRYSCAQRLFDQGVPLKTVGDYLGHRNPESTQRYTKIALEQLREVAVGDGEELL
jgi:site-specific recombinase XerD